jgi:hypothetical protein
MDDIAAQKFSAPAGDDGLAQKLADYGIVTVPAATYEWGGYRYTNAHDALAAAKRGKA